MRALPDVRAHILALEAVLREAGWQVFVGDVTAPNPELPYVMVQGVTGVGRDVDLAHCPVEVDERVQVTVVSDTVVNCLDDVTRVRRILNGRVLNVPGRMCFPLRLIDSMPATLDRQVTRPETGTHPAYAVDAWRVASTPQEDNT